MIFIGLVDELQEKKWNDEDPSFCLQKPNGNEKEVISNFENPHVYFVGTKRGCSCDLISYSKVSEDEYETEKREFYNIINQQFQKQNNVEVFCCWAENYTADIEERTYKSTIEDLIDFYIDENELLIYIPQQIM